MLRSLAASTRCVRLVCNAQQSSRPRPTPGSDPRLQSGSSESSGASEPEVKALQDADVEGVARVDAATSWQSDAGRVQLLVAGDAAALLLFAAIGRINHGEILGLELFATALPFWAGWFGAGSLLGAYGKDAQDGYVAPAALAAAKTWAIATPVSLALRGLLKGYAPPSPFIAVSFVVTGALMVGWRSALAAATKPIDQLTPLELHRRNKDKKGNAAEFMQLLSSLTKRW